MEIVECRDGLSLVANSNPQGGNGLWLWLLPKSILLFLHFSFSFYHFFYFFYFFYFPSLISLFFIFYSSFLHLLALSDRLATRLCPTLTMILFPYLMYSTGLWKLIWLPLPLNQLKMFCHRSLTAAWQDDLTAT